MSKLIVNATYYHGAISFDDIDLLNQYKANLKDGAELTVTFEPRREYRTEGMVNLFNVAYERWAKEQGYQREYARDFMKWRHGVKWDVEIDCMSDLQEFTDKPGHFVELEDSYCFLLSTNAYTKEQMHQLIEGTLRDLEEAQIDTSDLRQEWRLAQTNS